MTLYVYLGLIGKDIFTQNFFNRAFILLDQMADIRRTMQTKTADPNTIDIARMRLADASKDIIALDEILNYIKESLDCMTLPTMPSDPPGRKLYEVLDVATTRHELMRRITDLRKTTTSSKQELAILTQMSEALVADRAYYMQNQLNTNTASIRDIVITNTNVHHTLNMVQTILCGLLAFALLDRLTGTWTVTNREWAQTIVEPLLGSPYIFLILNLMCWAGLSYACARTITKKSQETAMYAQIKLILDEKIHNVERFTVWLSTKDIVVEDSTWEVARNSSKIMWQEKGKTDWGGFAPKVELEYDADNSYILNVTVYYSKAHGKLVPPELRARILDELREWDVIAAADALDEEDEED